MNIPDHIAPGMRGARECQCGGRFRRHWHKDLKAGIHRQKYGCERCGSTLIETIVNGELVATERTPVQRTEPKPSSFPHWLELPVSAECWSRRV